MNTGAEPGKLILSWEFWEFWERLLQVVFAGDSALGIFGNFWEFWEFFGNILRLILAQHGKIEIA